MPRGKYLSKSIQSPGEIYATRIRERGLRSERITFDDDNTMGSNTSGVAEYNHWPRYRVCRIMRWSSAKVNNGKPHVGYYPRVTGDIKVVLKWIGFSGGTDSPLWKKSNQWIINYFVIGIITCKQVWYILREQKFGQFKLFENISRFWWNFTMVVKIIFFCLYRKTSRFTNKMMVHKYVLTFEYLMYLTFVIKTEG